MFSRAKAQMMKAEALDAADVAALREGKFPTSARASRRRSASAGRRRRGSSVAEQSSRCS
jgi:hypothetical protein